MKKSTSALLMTTPFQTLLFIITFLSNLAAIGQNETGSVKPAEVIGGNELLELFVRHNIRTPLDSPGGSVEVRAVVETDGSTSNVGVIKSDNPALNAEALRVMRLFKGWRPATQDGKKARQPIRYTIQFPENKNTWYDKKLNGISVYLNKAKQLTDKGENNAYRIFIPSDGYGVPMADSVLISRFKKKEWQPLVKQAIRSEPVLFYSEILSGNGRDERDGFRIALEETGYRVKFPEYIVSGNRQVLKETHPGRYAREYYPNGQLASISTFPDTSQSHHISWHTNGLVGTDITRTKINRQDYIETWNLAIDSLNHVLLENGEGFIKNLSSLHGEGQITRGRKNGTWKSRDKSGQLLFEEEYTDGTFNNGISNLNGESIRYNRLSESALSKPENKPLVRSILQTLRYPISYLRSGHNETITISFTIEKDGTTSAMQITPEIPDKSFISDVERIIKNTSGKWAPATLRGIPVSGSEEFTLHTFSTMRVTR